MNPVGNKDSAFVSSGGRVQGESQLAQRPIDPEGPSVHRGPLAHASAHLLPQDALPPSTILPHPPPAQRLRPAPPAPRQRNEELSRGRSPRTHPAAPTGGCARLCPAGRPGQRRGSARSWRAAIITLTDTQLGKLQKDPGNRGREGRRPLTELKAIPTSSAASGDDGRYLEPSR